MVWVTPEYVTIMRKHITDYYTLGFDKKTVVKEAVEEIEATASEMKRKIEHLDLHKVCWSS
jgi:uncharacterized protein YlzI (FlbEa/FlbD family)